MKKPIMFKIVPSVTKKVKSIHYTFHTLREGLLPLTSCLKADGSFFLGVKGIKGAPIVRVVEKNSKIHLRMPSCSSSSPV